MPIERDNNRNGQENNFTKLGGKNNDTKPDEKTIIRRKFKPEIKLDPLQIVFQEGETNIKNSKQKDSVDGFTEKLGNEYPFISINNYRFEANEVRKMTIRSTSFLPTIQLEIYLEKMGVFTKNNFPKDGDIMSVFIASRNDIFQPIRNDYLITSVISSGNEYASGIGSEIMIKGELFIPHLYDQQIKGYKGKSIEILQQISRDLKLGYASNETQTDDEQIWINPNGTYIDLIQHITGAAWKNDKSFFTSFIDVYYNLNFINVNNQFTTSTALSPALLEDVFYNNYNKTKELPNKEDIQYESVKGFLSWPGQEQNPSSILNHTVVNNSTNISQEYGYKTHVHFYEYNSKKYWNIPVEPLVTEGVDDKILLKGRPNEDYWKTQINNYWLGFQYTLPEHNVHEKYYIAKIWNERNLAELDKIYLKITVPRINFNVIRYDNIPVFMVITRDDETQLATTSDNQEKNYSVPEPTLDQTNSGWYVASGFNIIYQQEIIEDEGHAGSRPAEAGFRQEWVLRRREWPTPKG